MKQFFKKGSDMPLEIERRYLVLKMSGKRPSSRKRIKKASIKQGYIETNIINQSFRIRIINNKKAVVTIKSGKGLIRKEEEFPINLKLAKKLISLCHSSLDKTRYYDGRWEVDFFKGPLGGLVLMEVELNSPEEEVELPLWAEEVVEVTDSLNNHHLARLASTIQSSGASPVATVLAHVKSPIPKIVLTGGPCTGKSTFIKLFKEERDDVHCVPEVASIVIGQLGIKPPGDVMANREFQRFIHRVQSIFETTSIQYAVGEGKKAVLLDRGKVDGAGYLEGGIDEYAQILNTDIESEYSHYDCVICLGIPPRDIYEKYKKNNPNRSEDYATAFRASEKIKKAWEGHPNFVFISGNGTWKRKVEKIKKEISKIIS